jgi:hypothetical protein
MTPERHIEEAKPILIGVGMPAALHLDAFGQSIYDAFGEIPYLVGSAMHTKQWRDIDVRLMLPDDAFQAMFPDYTDYNQADPKWALLCAAISELGRVRTGLPIDFQIQPVSDANKRYPKPRNPLGLHYTRADADKN